MNTSYTIDNTDEGKIAYQRMLSHMQKAQRPVYVVVMTERPDSYQVPAGKTAGTKRDKSKSVVLSDPVEVDSVVSVRKLR